MEIKLLGAARRCAAAALAVAMTLSLAPITPPAAALTALSAGAAEAPVIQLDPADSTYAKNAQARFYVRAMSPDGGFLSYQWFTAAEDRTYPGMPGDPEPIDGATGSVLTTTTPGTPGIYYYWAEITNTVSESSETVTSALAETKIVDRELAPAVVNGGFEGGTAGNVGPSPQRSAEYWWPRASYPFRWETGDFKTNNVYYTSGNTSTYVDAAIEKTTPSQFRSGLPNGSHGMVVELAAMTDSSLFQEIATVPGKIYEWSFDHAERYGSSGSTEGIGLVIGPTINEESDYNGVTDRWGTTDLAGKNPKTFPYAHSASTTDAALQVYHLGGAKDSYMNDIFNAFAEQEGKTLAAIIEDVNYLYKPQSVVYNGHTYYLYLATTAQRDNWKTYSGVYTVPAGSGTTLFSWVALKSVQMGGGNILDNVVFDSGTTITTSQEMTYSGEPELFVDTKAGFAYALAEVRGSSVITLGNLDARYSASGAAAVLVSPDSGLGDGASWYSSAVGDGGVLAFFGLTPGKTYRIIGIPAAAISTTLETNISPADVLDDGYYSDVKIMPAKLDDDGGTVAAVSAGLAEDGVTAFITVENSRSSVEYALLAALTGDDEKPSENPVEPWTSGGGELRFTDLTPGTAYFLVVRPLGYNEISYAAASWNGETLAARRVITPAGGQDLLARQVSRAAGGGAITITDTLAGYSYALVDPVSGAIFQSADAGGDGDPVTFEGLDAALTYRAAAKPPQGSYMKGVRVLPFPAELEIDYENNRVKVKNGDQESDEGYIPADVETSFDGGENWTLGTNSDFLDLSGVFESAGAVTYRVSSGGFADARVQPELTLEFPARPAAPGEDDYNINYIAESFESVSALEVRAGSAGEWRRLEAGESVSFAELGWRETAARRLFLRFPASQEQEGETFASAPFETAIAARPAAPGGLSAAEPDGGFISVSGFTPGRDYLYKIAGVDSAFTPFTAPDGGVIASLPFETGQSYEFRFAASADAPMSAPATVKPEPISLDAVNFGVFVYGETVEAQPVNVRNTDDAPVDSVTFTLAGPDAGKFELNIIQNPASVPSGENSGLFTVSVKSGEILPAGDYKATITAIYGAEDPPAESSAAAAEETPPAEESANGESTGEESAGEESAEESVNTENIAEPPAAESAEEAGAAEISGGEAAGEEIINEEAAGIETFSLKTAAAANIGAFSAGGAKTYSAEVSLSVEKAEWDTSKMNVSTSDVTKDSFTLTLTGAPAGAAGENAALVWRFGDGIVTPADNGGGAYMFTGLTARTAYAVNVQAKGDLNHNESPVIPLGIARTAMPAPESGTARINYDGERLEFSDGTDNGDAIAPGNYTVTINEETVVNGGSVTQWADTGFTVSVTRNAYGGYPESAAISFEVAGRVDAVGLTASDASTDVSSDGAIIYGNGGSFQYRVHSESGGGEWTDAVNKANVRAGSYDARNKATATAFASKPVKLDIKAFSLAVSVTSVKARDGASGTADTTALDVTFNRAVSGFDKEHIKFTSANAAQFTITGVAVSGTAPSAFWRVDISGVGTAATGTVPLTAEITGWTAASGDKYTVTSGGTSAVTAYRAVHELTPAAVIDFANERITGFTPGASYGIAPAGGSFVETGAVGADGTIPIDSGWFGKTLSIIKRGGANSVDSTAFSLNIPARPAAPGDTVTVSSKTVEDKTVGTLQGLNQAKQYEYYTDYAPGVIKATALGDASVDITLADGLSSLVVYIREKDTDSSFDGDAARRVIMPPGSVDLGGALEGYDSSATGKTVSIANVNITDIAPTGGDSPFTVAKTGDTWTAAAKPGLAAGEYRDVLTVSAASGTLNTPIHFTVYQNAVIKSVTAGLDASGATDRVIIEFEYPITLSIGDIDLGPAVSRDASGFRDGDAASVRSVYTVGVLPNLEYKTGDTIDVTVRLDAANFAYQIAQGQQNTLTGAAALTIPRRIAEARAVTPVAGYSTSYIQFTLAKPVNTPVGYAIYAENLNWRGNAGDYSGPIELTVPGGALKKANITYIAQVNADMDYTYRVFFTQPAANIPSGNLTISIPEWGVAAFPVSGTVVSRNDTANGAVYILDRGGHNLITDLNGYQQIPSLDAKGGITVPELLLPTSLEYSSSIIVKAVYVNGEPLNDAFYETQAGAKNIMVIVDDEPWYDAPLGTQLTLRLKTGWADPDVAAAGGGFSIIALFDDNTALFGYVKAENVTKSYILTVEGGTPSGRYAADTAVNITAPQIWDGLVFDRWTASAAAGAPGFFANAASEHTTYTTTASAAVLTANYRNPVPAAAVDYAGEKLTGLKPEEHYKITAGSTVVYGNLTPEAGEVSIGAGWFGKTITIINLGSGNVADSAPQTVVIRARPAKPEGLTARAETYINFKDGEISGVTTTMEYSINGTDWAPCGTTGKLTGLAPAVYHIRYAAADAAFSSAIADIAVSAGGTSAIWSIAHDKSESPVSAGETQYGYTGNNAVTVTVKNTGNQPLTAAVATLTGDDASRFAITGGAIGELAPGVTRTFSVAPNPGLDPKEFPYEATVEITAAPKEPARPGASEASIKASFDITFKVERANALTADHLEYDIPTNHVYNGNTQGIGAVSVDNPYDAGAGKVTVKYNDSETEPTNAGTYTVTANIAEGARYEAATGLSLGTYTIAPKLVQPTGVTATREYNGTNTFDNDDIKVDSATFPGKVETDTLVLEKTNVTGGTLSDASVGAGTLAVAGAFTLTGESANNYALTQPEVIATITKADNTFTAVQVGGTDGKVETTAIRITFTQPVTYFDVGSELTLTGASLHGASDIGTQNTEWIVPITLDPGTANGNKVKVEITELRNYNITPKETDSDKATVYKPVLEDTPEAEIDYTNEWLEELAEDEKYIIRVGADDLERTADGSGQIPIEPDWMGKNISVVKKGGAATVDSDPQTLTIPARLPAPTLTTIVQPTQATATGSFTIGNYDSSKTYEYRDVTDDDTTGWQSITGDSISGLAVKAYYVRVKAGTNFHSQSANVRFYAYNEVRFESVLQGYKSIDAVQITSTTGEAITDVVWTSGSESNFELSGLGASFTVKPINGLLPNDYTANLTIKHNGSTEEPQTVAIKVYDKVEIASVDAINNVTTGLTEQIKITFTYPVSNLMLSDVTITGGVHKDISAAAFAAGTNYTTTYVIDVIPQEHHKTGDTITVSINLNSANLGGTYAFQTSKEGATVQNSTAKVTIPREIAVQRLGQIEDYSTSYIQVELTGYPIPEAAIGSAMKITNGTGAAIITQVIPVTDSPGVYRVFLNVTTSGTVKLSIPDYGVEATGDIAIVKAADLSAATYFLDNSGNNYHTDNDGFQKLLPESDALGEIQAPKYELYTSEEYSAKEVASVHIKNRTTEGNLIKLDEDMYTVTANSNTAGFIFDGGTPVSLTNQLVITLNSGWTGYEPGDNDYEITVIFKDKPNGTTRTAALGVLRVLNVTRSYDLTVAGGTVNGTESGRFAAGTAVSVKAPQTLDGGERVFDKWTAVAADGAPGVFANAASGQTTYTTTASAAALTANYRRPVPAIAVNYSDEELTGFKPEERYGISASKGNSYTSKTADADGTLAIENGWFGSELTITRLGSAEENAGASLAQTLTVKPRPAKPADVAATGETFTGFKDGAISGVTEYQEYSSDSGASWQECGIKGELTGLTPGTYLVRYKAVPGASFKSESATLTVSAGTTAAKWAVAHDKGVAVNAGDAQYGYAGNYAVNVSVTNTGNQPLTGIKAALTGSDASSFTLTSAAIGELAPGASRSFTVSPKSSLHPKTGAYSASVSVSGSPKEPGRPGAPAAQSVTASFTVNFTVNKAAARTAADLEYTIPANRVYNGNPQGIGAVTVESAYRSGTGAVTVRYNGSAAIPANAGTYAVTADIAEGADYQAAEGLQLGSYTIAKKSVKPTGVTAEKIYDGTDIFTPWQMNADAAQFPGKESGDELKLDKADVISGALHSTNVGAGTLDIAGAFKLVGASANNYALTQPEVSATITKAEIAFEAAQYGGVNGKETTTHIAITFTKPVADFTAGGTALTGASTRGAAEDITASDETPHTKWRVPITPSESTTNGGVVSVTVINLTNYNVAPANPVNVTVYKPVREATPNAAIDYAGEKLQNLTANDRRYIINGLERTADAGGYIPIEPDWIGGSVSVIKKGGAATVDSEAQSLQIPARLPAPTLTTVVQPTQATATGSFTIGNYDSTKTYEYRNVTADDNAWSDLNHSNGTASNIAVGAYYVRVKAGTNFHSQSANVRFYAYNEVRFESVLQGYTSTEIKAVQSSEITGLEWKTGSSSNFEIEDFSVKRRTGLEPKDDDYSEVLTIHHNGTSDEEQTVKVKVYKKVEIKSVTALPEDGLTNQIKIEFAYPVDLVWDDVTITGGVHKDASKNDFASTTNSKIYVIDVTPQEHHKTGDAITVSINLNSANLSGTYAFQASKEGATVTNSEAEVTIPRGIELQRLGQVSGYSTGYIQFKLTGYPIPAEYIVEYDMAAGYDGALTLTGTGGASAAITAVIPVTAGEEGAYRAFLNVETGGAVELSVPDFDVAAIQVTGIEKGSDFTGASYFLDAHGDNYITTPDGFQRLPELDALNSITATAYTLRTSEDFSKKAVTGVYVRRKVTDGVETSLGADKYEVTGAGSADFLLDGIPVPSGHMNSQLIITLKNGWSGTYDYGDNVYEITVIFRDKTNGELSVAMGEFGVVNVTRSYDLKVVGGTVNGMASGRFAAGAVVNITAPQSLDYGERVFYRWTANSANPDNPGAIAGPSSASTTYTMAAGAAVLTANYRRPVPSVSVDYEDEKLTGLDSGESYKITIANVVSDGVTVSAEVVEIAENWFGKTLTITRLGSDNIADSLPQTVHIHARPASPKGLTATDETYTGFKDGTIKGITGDMEYLMEISSDSGASWSDCEEGESVLTGLTPGTYLVRYKAVPGASFKSESATLTVSAGTTAAEWAVTHNNGEMVNAGSVEYGYAGSYAVTVNVTNTGNQPLTGIKAALTGTDASSFTLTSADIGELAPGASRSFTVSPKSSLHPKTGAYSASVSVSGSPKEPGRPGAPAAQSVTASFTVNFTVNKAAARTAADLEYTIPANRVYNGNSQGIGAVTVESVYRSGTGAVTVRYDGSAAIPANAGTYAVTANIAEGADYQAATGLSLGTYTIAPKTVQPTDVTATREYNGTNTFNNDDIKVDSATFPEKVGADSLILEKTNVTGGTLSDANVGAGMLAVAGAFTLTGESASNYTLIQPTVAATITKADNTFTAVQVGGADGKVETTHIAITFTKPVADFTAGGTALTGASTRGAAEDITASDETPHTKWRVPITPAPETDNGEDITVKISELRNYTISGTNPATVPVFKPVPETKPAATINYSEEQLENLTAGDKHYIIEGLDRTANADGYIPIEPDWMDGSISIVKKGEATSVDSEAQTLPIPARPPMPTLTNIVQPTQSVATGSFTISNYDSGKTYEYRNVTPVDAAWSDLTHTDGVASNIAVGAYYVRVKAGTNFHSQSASVRFYVHTETRFDSVLRGYASITAVDVTSLVDITEVALTGGDTAKFTLGGSGADRTVAPIDDLPPGDYNATLTIKHNNSPSDDETQTVAIKVYDKVEIASVDAINNVTTGLTEQIKITFTYPVSNLMLSDVTLTGGVHKDASKNDFASKADSKIYVVDVIPQEHHKTGDAITVSINLNSANLGGTYAFQASKEGAAVQNSTAKVTIPREIAVQRLGQIEDYSTSYIQVELTGYPIPEASISSAMKITNGTGAAIITQVIPVTDSPGVYRVFLNVTTSGTVKLSIPDYGVEATGDIAIVKAADLSAATYFLDNSGNNYHTDNDGFQKLRPESDALGEIQAPEYKLYTSVSLDNNDVESTHIKNRAGGIKVLEKNKHYTVTANSGAANFIFDGGAPVPLTNQLVITLNSGWTGYEPGANDYEITVIFKDKPNGTTRTAALGVLRVLNVTRSYDLTVIGGTASVTGRYAEGDIIDITTDETRNQDAEVFKEWQTTNGGVIAATGSASTTYTMPASDATVTAIYDERPDAPTITINYAERKLITKDTATYKITANGVTVEKTADSETIGGSIAIDPSWFGKTLTIRKTEPGEPDSISAAIDIKPIRPAPGSVSAIDETYAGFGDGRLTGVTAAMEYREESADAWTAGTGVAIENLAPGVYVVRYAATDGAEFSGQELRVSIRSGIAPVWSVSLGSESEINFAVKPYGYTAVPRRDVTVTNDGNRPTGSSMSAPRGTDGKLTVSLAKGENSPFELTEVPDGGITSLAPGAASSFGVRPKPGFAVGYYEDTLTVANGDNGISKTIALSFTVQRANILSFGVVPSFTAGKAGEIPDALNSLDKITAKLNSERGTVAAHYEGGEATANVTWAYTGHRDDMAEKAYTPNELPYVNQMGVYVFEGTATSFADPKDGNIKDGNINIPQLKATAYVIVNDVPHAISLDTSGTYIFKSEPYGYEPAPTPRAVTVYNQGTLSTGVLKAELVGAGAAAFRLSPEDGVIASIDAVGSDESVSVGPKEGLAPGVYTAMLTVYGIDNTDIVHKSYSVSFTVRRGEITGFAPIPSVSAGAVGYGAKTAAELWEDNALPKEITAYTTYGDAQVPVIGWTSAYYDNAVPGSYIFTAALGQLPPNTVNPDSLTAQLAVAVSSPVHAEPPVFTREPEALGGFVGTKRKLTAEASVADGGDLSYQWYSNTVREYIGGAPIAGETKSYTVPGAAPGVTYYWCEAVNENQSATGEKTSRPSRSAIAEVTLMHAKLTVENGEAELGASGEAGKYMAYEPVTITADAPPEGKAFDVWEQLSGKNIALPSAPEGQIIMPEDDIAVKALYKDIPDDVKPPLPPIFPDNNGGKTDGEGASAGTIPADGGAVKLNYKETDGNVVIELPPVKIGEIIANSADGAVSVDVSAIKDARAVTFTPKTGLSDVAQAGLRVVILFPNGEISLNAAASKSLVAQAEGTEITIEVIKTGAGALTPAQTAALPQDAEPYVISIYSRGEYIHTYAGEILVSVPYAGRLPAGAWYMKDDGVKEKVPSVYNSADKAVTFRPPHLSRYVVGYAGDKWENPFADVALDDWFYGDVEYATEYGIFKGTSETTFEPRAQMTRAMFVTALYRMSGSPAVKQNAGFNDVDGESWYGDAVSWAARSGIVNGVGDNKFAPDRPITRQELVTSLYRYAVFNGTGPTGNWASRIPFDDVADIADWATEAVMWATQKGIVTGKPGNMFDPRGTATRAEAAAALRRYLF